MLLGKLKESKGLERMEEKREDGEVGGVSFFKGKMRERNGNLEASGLRGSDEDKEETRKW